MSDATPLQRWRTITLKLFPWLARIGLAPSGALQIKSAAGRTEIEGGGPAALRVGDGGWLLFDPGIPATTPPVLYYSTLSAFGPFSPVVVVAVPGTPPPLGMALPPGGTQIAPSGSSKVTVG